MMTLRSARLWLTIGIGVFAIIVIPWVLLSSSPDAASATSLGFLQLLVINPCVFVIGTIYVWVRGRPYVVLTAAAYSLAFLISLVTSFNSTALVYLAAYLILCIIAVLLDHAFKRLFSWWKTRKNNKAS